MSLRDSFAASWRVAPVGALFPVVAPAQICPPTPDVKAPRVAFVDPAKDNLYVQDAMRTYVVSGLGSTTISSITVKVVATEPFGESGVASVAFFVDNQPVPAQYVNPSEPYQSAPGTMGAYYSFRYMLDGMKTGSHEILAVATDY